MKRPVTSISLLLILLSLWECHAFTLLPSRGVPLTVLEVTRGRRPPMPVKKEDRPPMNEEIQAPEVRVVVASAGGKDLALGVMSRKDALAKARESGGLDLILINDKSDPPVCKIVDYSKYRYMQEKKSKEIKKNSKASELKEVKMSYKIDVHDYSVRKKNASKFLQQGNRVKCTVMFRGREMQHDKLGYDLLEKLANELGNVAATEGRPKREGRNLSLILGPRPEVMKAISDGRRAQEKEKKKKKAEELEQRRASKGGIAILGEEEEEDFDEDDEDDEDDDDDYDYDSSSALNLEDEDEDEEDDEDDGNDDDDDDDDDSLDALLGGDQITNDLFK